MPNLEHDSIARKGASEILAWRSTPGNVRLDLSEADLAGVDLRGADLSNADLHGADLSRARLNSANLYLVNASLAKFHGADLRLAQIRGARLTGCDLTGALLIGATLRTVDLGPAKLGGARFGGTIISATDLSEVSGLDSTRHDRHNSIGIDTIVQSRGRIHPYFLRASGVPEVLVKIVLNLSKDALAFYSCFISYNEKDTKLSEQLYRDLEKKGVRSWRWREDAPWGTPLQSTIDRALEDHEKVIVILSQHSLDAKPVLYEIEHTLSREEHSRRAILFPLRIDDAIFEWKDPLRDRILKKTVGDFTRWKTKAGYSKALERLLKDLRAE